MLYKKPGFVHPKGDEDEMFVDIGAYGRPQIQNYRSIDTTKKLEQFVMENDG